MNEIKSSSHKPGLIAELGDMVMRWQDATQKYDEAVGEIYGLGPAERLCLSLLWRGPLTASVIAREVRLTPAAVTALVDRLEKRGFVRRTADPGDRRKVLVEAADATLALVREVYQPMAEAGAATLETYSEAELALVAKALEDMMGIQLDMTRNLLARHSKE